MQSLNIAITKSRISSFSISYSAEGAIPEVSVSIALLTEGGKTITTYSISSEHWQTEKKFDMPTELLLQLPKFERELERIVTEHCQNSTLALT